jgi:hypothetical protein
LGIHQLANVKHGSTQNVEASLYCIKRTQEAVPSQDNRFLALLFSPDILGRIPISGNHRVRRTAITVLGMHFISQIYPILRSELGEYTSWFATQPTELLLQVVSFVIAALPEPSLSSAAASALKDICDANRASLAPHIGAFASLYAGLNVVAVSLNYLHTRFVGVIVLLGRRQSQSSPIYHECHSGFASIASCGPS